MSTDRWHSQNTGTVDSKLTFVYGAYGAYRLCLIMKPKNIRFQIDATVGGSMFKYPGIRVKFPTKTMMLLAKKASQYPQKTSPKHASGTCFLRHFLRIKPIKSESNFEPYPQSDHNSWLKPHQTHCESQRGQTAWVVRSSTIAIILLATCEWTPWINLHVIVVAACACWCFAYIFWRLALGILSPRIPKLPDCLQLNTKACRWNCRTALPINHPTTNRIA